MTYNSLSYEVFVFYLESSGIDEKKIEPEMQNHPTCLLIKEFK